MSEPRSYLVGETIRLRTRVSRPGTKIPVDPDTVVLTSLRRRGQETLADPLAFTKEAVGEYSLTIQTDDLVPGVYDLTVTYTTTYEDGEDVIEEVTMDRDAFVLRVF